MDITCHNMKKHTPKVNDAVRPDGWMSFSNLTEGNSYSDSSFPGCEFYLPSCNFIDVKYAVNIKVTGKPHFVSKDWYKSRVKIEFVGDGEPSTFEGGWIWHLAL